MVVDAQPDAPYESQMHVIESLCRRRVAQRPLDRGKASKQIRKEHVRIQNARAIRKEKESGMIHPLRRSRWWCVPPRTARRPLRQAQGLTRGHATRRRA